MVTFVHVRKSLIMGIESYHDRFSRRCSFYFCCKAENIDKPLLAAPIINKTLEDHPVYDTPVMVVGAMSHNSLRMTLETLIMQPGIRSENVFVCIDEKLTELGALVDLFGFHYVKIESSFNYTEIMHKAFKKIFESGELIDEVYF